MGKEERGIEVNNRGGQQRERRHFAFEHESSKARKGISFVFVYFFGALECVGHSFAYVEFFRDVWMRTQRSAVASRRATIATHLPS
jgi:hypothetical protein